MTATQKRQPLEGHPREFEPLLDGKRASPALRYNSSDSAFYATVSLAWQTMCIVQLVYSAGSWHHEGVTGRWYKDRKGEVHTLGGNNTHKRSHGGQAR